MLLASPEQRLSLELKWHELWEQQKVDVCSSLQRMAGNAYLDILDESDELLHHR